MDESIVQAQTQTEKLDESKVEKEQRIEKMEAKAAQNVNLYFIFQAVILMSTATATSLTCHHWWLPMILSLLAALQNFFAFTRTMIGVRKGREELDHDALELAFMKVNRGGNERAVRPKIGSCHKWRGGLLSFCPMGLFVVFSGLVMYGCHNLLCNTNGGKFVKTDAKLYMT